MAHGVEWAFKIPIRSDAGTDSMFEQTLRRSPAERVSNGAFRDILIGGMAAVL